MVGEMAAAAARVVSFQQLSWPPRAYSTRVFATPLQIGMLSTGAVALYQLFYNVLFHIRSLRWRNNMGRPQEAFVRPQSFYYVIAVFGQNCVIYIELVGFCPEICLPTIHTEYLQKPDEKALQRSPHLNIETLL